MNLSPHFSLAELTTTQVRGVDNTPSAKITDTLRYTAARMETVRAILRDRPIVVTSGYRHPIINRIVGGSQNSAHMSGHAVDFICPAFGSPLDIAHAIAASDLMFDQLIEEGTWVHLSFDPRMRRQVKTKTASGALAEGLPETSMG